MDPCHPGRVDRPGAAARPFSHPPRGSPEMKLCRYDDNKIGLVRGRNLHDVTAILEALPPLRYPVAFGDQLIANLDKLRPRMEALADKAAPQPVDKARLLSPVANP